MPPIQLCHSVHPIRIFLFAQSSLYTSAIKVVAAILHGFMGAIRMENLPSLNVNSLSAI